MLVILGNIIKRFSMKFLFLIFLFQCFSCVLSNENSPLPSSKQANNSTQNSDEKKNTPLCVKEFVDGLDLGNPQTYPDQRTQKTIDYVKNTKKELKLAVGVSNRNAELRRFYNECHDWVLLDINGVANGPDFLHMDVGDLYHLTKLADQLSDRFNLIAIDYSVTRLVRDFRWNHIFQLLRMLKKNGHMALWYDENPFQIGATIKTNHEFNDALARAKESLRLVKTVLAKFSSDRPAGIYGFTTLSAVDFNIKFYQKLSSAEDEQWLKVVSEYDENKRELLKKSFSLMNIDMKFVQGNFPLPRGHFDYSKLKYIRLTKN